MTKDEHPQEKKDAERQAALAEWEASLDIPKDDIEDAITVERAAVTWWERTKRRLGID